MRRSSFVLLLLVALCAFFTFASCSSDDDDRESSQTPNQNDDDAVDDDASVDDDTADDDAGDDDTQDDDTDDDTADDDTDDDTTDDDSGDDDTGDDDTSTTLIPLNTVFTVSGVDSRYGSYEGQVEIRGSEDEPNFIRIVQYGDFTFPDPRKDINYDVSTVWTGQIDPDTGIASISLKVADFISQYNGLFRTGEDGAPVAVTGQLYEAKDGEIAYEFYTPEDQTHMMTATETWSSPVPAGEKPLFVNEDTYLASHNPMPDWMHNFVFAVFNEYHQLPFFDNYRDREDFNLGVHYISQFRTDFDWYRANPDSLRVPDKWLDDISMAEEMLRARSFSPTLTAKAIMFDEEMPVYYLNSLGMFSSAQWGSQPLAISESGDSLLWTGCYLASQVFRYLVTGEQAALDNWLRALDGLILSHDIVQDDTSFARAVRPHVDDGDKEWIQGTSPYEAYDWLCCGNNDMIQGLYYGYTLSWIYLPADSAYDEYRTKIAERAARLADYCTVSLDGEFNEIKAAWLAWMTTGDTKYRDRYQELYANPLLGFYSWAGGGMFYLWGISDWSGQHLDTIGQLILWFLAEQTGDSDAVDLLKTGWVNGMRLNSMTQTLWPIVSKSLTDIPVSVDDVYDLAVWNMREIQFPKQKLAIDKEIDPAWCPSPIPSLFWKLDWMDGGRNQGLYGVPMWARDQHSNMWVPAPFDFQQGETDWTDGGGADFLHAYWFGRYYGIFTEDD